MARRGSRTTRVRPERLAWLSIVLGSERLPVQFRVSTCLVAGSVTSWSEYRRQSIDVSLTLTFRPVSHQGQQRTGLDLAWNEAQNLSWSQRLSPQRPRPVLPSPSKALQRGRTAGRFAGFIGGTYFISPGPKVQCPRI